MIRTAIAAAVLAAAALTLIETTAIAAASPSVHLTGWTTLPARASST